ncbi:MAG TPA: urate hydroxylase PuuD [Burkholderiales bacterium]|nr:urate hydroxylase PuuD [Burkholderiales bacterium]
MEAYLLDWLTLVARWAHIVVAIAWIGASFYFIWVDNHLEAPEDAGLADGELAGELYAIHGGGFYRAQKYRLAPPQLPKTLHWFKWEAYWTWITGFALLVLVYYVHPELYLIDSAVMKLSTGFAIGIGLASLVVGLAVYEGLCRSPLARNEWLFAIALFLFLAGTAWGLTHVFSGRGAFLHFGAILGTIMAGNVAHVIIPGQREFVRAKKEGRLPNEADAIRGKQRSVHNTYFTLPVILTMISGHHAMTFSHSWNWLVLIALTLAGALVRLWFVARHKGRPPAWTLALGILVIVATFMLLAPRPQNAGEPVAFSEIKQVLDARCLSCHAERPAFRGIAEAPKGIKLDSEERIRAQAPLIQQTVRARTMPPGNLTGLTEEERALIERWNP